MQHKRVLFFILLMILTTCMFPGCRSGGEKGSKRAGEKQREAVLRDLPEMRKDGTLRAITIFSPTSYFLYRGQTMGFEYELLRNLAAHLELELEIIVADDLDLLFDMLKNGEGDLVAHGMTITKSRKEEVAFTHPLFESNQVLVQRKPKNWRKMKLHEIEKQLITNPIDLIGKRVHVRKNSSYFQRLKNLSQEIGGEIIIDTVAGYLTTDEIIQMVVDGEIDYTIADNNLAAITAAYYPILDVNTTISLPQRIAWATRKNSGQLLDTVNAWIDRMKDQTEYYVIYNKYFKNRRLYRKRIGSEFYSETSGRISKYDDLIKKNAARLGWDWRLLSALIYQESRFDNKATSWAGGKGLMQLMPATAKELGVQDRTNPAENIRGGTDYLQYLWSKWEEIPDSVQRIKFTLASYNCGFHHVADAKRLAARYEADSSQWDDAVEKYLLKLTYPRYYNDEAVKYGYVRGIEPYEYVRKIFERYANYSRFTDPA